MKKLIFLFAALFSGIALATADDVDGNYRYDGSRYIFMEGGIEFSVYPDGEFDFVIPQVVNGLSLNVNTGPVNISFNSGYNYDPYVQYDQYGAVIQIEDVPVYYDNWGRIIQAGNVYISYDNNRIVRVGGLQVYYSGAQFSHVVGYINVYNRGYAYQPYHDFFYRPYYDRCLVYTVPYRRFYRRVHGGRVLVPTSSELASGCTETVQQGAKGSCSSYLTMFWGHLVNVGPYSTRL